MVTVEAWSGVSAWDRFHGEGNFVATAPKHLRGKNKSTLRESMFLTEILHIYIKFMTSLSALMSSVDFVIPPLCLSFCLSLSVSLYKLAEHLDIQAIIRIQSSESEKLSCLG